jgi:hypothetical protein
MEKIRNVYRIFVGKPEGKPLLENYGVCGWITLKWILKKSGWRVWIRLIWVRTGSSSRFL